MQESPGFDCDVPGPPPHVPFLHALAWQSPSTLHFFFGPHPPHAPPQSVSVSEPSLAPFRHMGRLTALVALPAYTTWFDEPLTATVRKTLLVAFSAWIVKPVGTLPQFSL